MKTTLTTFRTRTILPAMAMAAAIHLTPAGARADVVGRYDSSIGGAEPSRMSGRPTTLPAGPEKSADRAADRATDRSAALSAARAIERDARELYNLSARGIRNGSRDEVTALNRLNDLQRAAADYAVSCERRGGWLDEHSAERRAFTSAYDAAQDSWRWLDRVGGARDYAVRIEASYGSFHRCFARPMISWRDVAELAGEIEEAAEHLYDVVRAEADGYADHRTRDARREALLHIRELRSAARDFERLTDRCGSNPRNSFHEYLRLADALECVHGRIRLFSRHADRDFHELESLVEEIEPFYGPCRTTGSPWGRGGIGFELHAGPRVIGSVR